MAITSANEAIASLIDLAEQGNIDPWDVPVIEVIDRFLSELGLQDLDTALVQANLPQSGQAFLWASRLVLYKADTLERLAEVEEEEILDLISFDENDLTRRLPLNLEQHIRRRTSVLPHHKRRVTLQELITQLQQIASELETLPTPKRDRPRLPSHRETLKTITELAHQENLTELAAELDEFLEQQLQKRELNSINFEELLSWWSKKKGIDEQKDRVAIFWALLLLCSQSSVELYQADFYQDLTITKS